MERPWSLVRDVKAGEVDVYRAVADERGIGYPSIKDLSPDHVRMQFEFQPGRKMGYAEDYFNNVHERLGHQPSGRGLYAMGPSRSGL